MVERLATVADTRVRADDVEPAELFDAAVHRGLDCVVVTHVHLGGDDAPVQLLDQVRGFRQIVGSRRLDLRIAADRAADVDRDDVGALFGQANRVATSLAARRAGDECDLALYASRHNFPRSRRLDQKLIDRSGTFAWNYRRGQ